MPFPFEVPFAQVEANLDACVDAVFACLESTFMTLPKGPGFIEYPVFERGYEELKRATHGFRTVTSDVVLDAVNRLPVSFVVLRAILGFTPPEWAYVTRRRPHPVSQEAARSLDRRIRLHPLTPLQSLARITDQRLRALVDVACELLAEGAPEVPPDVLHRLEKADTKQGLSSIQPMADLGVPYAMVLYERFLGRPFAGHRDSVSELVGGVLETAIEGLLNRSGVTYRKTKRAERVSGFDQAPDFIVPDEFSPQVVIEAKLTEDDGTARDKVTRVQHLHALSLKGVKGRARPRFEVVACIAGRGFKVRREDMKKLLLATRGKVFTLETLNRLIDCTRLRQFVAR